MPIRLSESKSQLVGAMAAAFFGLGLLITGGRLIVYDYMLADPAKVSASAAKGSDTISQSKETLHP